MRLRLAGGVVAAPGLAAWLPRAPSNPGQADEPARAERHAQAYEPARADESHAPGAAVALGPATASDEDVRQAVNALRLLVVDGGIVAAGAGVDLGAGFRSARLEGARGDQRDAVLAALKVLGVEGAGRLGDRAGFLVALFGPAVTKRVGAEAARAIAEGRWAALHLASASSDVLGPEQLERVLTLTCPEGVKDADLTGGGMSSVLAANLRRVLEPVTAPRRLDLVLDLWKRVAEHHAGLARRARLLATQGRQSRLDDLRERREHYEDQYVLSAMRDHLGREPALAAVARWRPPGRYWYALLNRILKDAFAATALLRTAIAVSDHGLDEGLARSAVILDAACGEFGSADATSASRRVPGLTGLPARPISYVRDLQRRPGPDAAHVRQRLARAHDYALLTIEQIKLLVDGTLNVPEDIMRRWASIGLARWRQRVGYSSVRPPSAWAGVPTWTHFVVDPREPLVDRLEALTDPDPAAVEEVGDLMWCADLVDALAMLHGHEAAALTPEIGAPWLEHDPEPETLGAALLARPYASLASSVSGAAQLVALGGTAKRGVRTWDGFVDALLADAKIAEALDGGFAVPAPLAAADGTVVPGTGGARFTVAGNARTLAEWSNYMGNCIAGPSYLEQAMAGRAALTALCGKDGRILINAELIPVRPAGRGWHVSEIAARFNEAPKQELEKRFRAWVSTIPGAGRPPVDEPLAEGVADVAAGVDAALEEAPSVLPVRTSRRAARPRLLEDAGPALTKLTRRAWAEEVTDEAARVLAELTGDLGPEAALTALRRLGPGPLAGACRNAIARGAVDLADLWDLTGIRPLRTALDGLDPSLHHRFGEQLALLTGTAPLPGSLRRLVRRPQLAPAYSMGLVGLRMRSAIGRLLLDGDRTIVQSVARRPVRPMLCALTVHLACAHDKGISAIDLAPVMPPRIVTVPGFPESALSDPDGPWQRAFPEARELGGDTGMFWDGIAEYGLRVPAAWVAGGGGWPVLWARAHHPRPRPHQAKAPRGTRS